MQDYQFVVGAAGTMFTIWAATFGWFFKALRRIENDVKEGDARLHSRVNQVVQDTVHKSDLKELGDRLNDNFRNLQEQNQIATRDTNKRLDLVLTAIGNRNLARSNYTEHED